jgi:arginine-tRNA-protein transferase
MRILHHFVSGPDACAYLFDQTMRSECLLVGSLSAEEYLALMNQSWRRFGRLLFRPVCSQCRECKPLRVDVQRFQANRSQRRAWKKNADDVTLTIGSPQCDAQRLDLHRRYHAFQADFKGWPLPHGDGEDSYRRMFLDNPFWTREYAYWLGNELIGVGYVDEVPRLPAPQSGYL